MNSSVVFCYALSGLLGLYLIFRIRAVTRLKNHDARVFSLFWVWPGLWFLFLNLVPFWSTPVTPIRVALIAMVLATLADFLYFYGFKSAEGKRQAISGLLLLPCLLFTFRHQLDPRSAEVLVLPHHGEALVWTDSAISPRVWTFIDPKTRDDVPDGPNFGRANYARAVFSPITGVVQAVDTATGRITLMAESGLVVTVGPMLAGATQVKPGQRVAANMPLGLTDLDPQIPGIRLEVVGDTRVHFADMIYGRFRANQAATAVPRRNDTVLSRSRGRFRVE